MLRTSKIMFYCFLRYDLFVNVIKKLFLLIEPIRLESRHCKLMENIKREFVIPDAHSAVSAILWKTEVNNIIIKWTDLKISL